MQQQQRDFLPLLLLSVLTFAVAFLLAEWRSPLLGHFFSSASPDENVDRLSAGEPHVHPRAKHFLLDMDGMNPPVPEWFKKRQQQEGWALKPARVVWAFWFGGLENMSPARKRALEMMKRNLGVPLRLITSMDDVRALSKPEDPIHPLVFHEPQVLSSNHIVDILRGYIMHHYGGGYLDVKPMYRNWSQYFSLFDDDLDLWFLAPPQRGWWDVGCHESYLAKTGLSPVDCDIIRRNWAYIGSDACWIARPYTPLTKSFRALVNETLNRKWDEILKNPVPPASKNRCCAPWINPKEWTSSPDAPVRRYPLRWVEVHAEAFDSLQLMWGPKHIRLSLPRYAEESYI
jgi:hypothetical protein